MNTGPGDAENPTGVFVPAHRGPVCAALRWPRYWPEAETNRRPPAAGPGRPHAVSYLRPAWPAGSSFLADPADHPIHSHPGPDRRHGRKSRKSCWRRAGRRLLTVLARIWAGSRRGRGMNSVTRGSGIALSALVAATASILLLLPGKPAGSGRGPGPPGQVVMASAVATSAWSPPGAGSQPAASSRAGGQPAAGPRPGCRAAGMHSGRAQAGLTTRWPGRARPGAARPGSCRPRRMHRPQHASRRLSRYRGIRPDLP